MGKLLAHVGLSVDGMFEGVDGDISWHCVDEPLHAHFNEVLLSAAAVISGRVNHVMMNDYWPTADQLATASPSEREFARFWREVPKYAVSTTLPDTGEWNTTVLRTIDPVEVRAIADAARGDVVVGGGQVIDGFRRADLIDEWRIYTHPVVVGAGRHLFIDGPGTTLDLLDTRRFPNGVVLNHYRVVRPQD